MSVNESRENTKQMLAKFAGNTTTFDGIITKIISHSLERALRDPSEKLVIFDSLHTKDGNWLTSLPICTIPKPTSESILSFIKLIRSLKTVGESFNLTTPQPLTESPDSRVPISDFKWTSDAVWSIIRCFIEVNDCEITMKDIPSVTCSGGDVFTSCLHIKTLKFCNSVLTIDPSSETVVFHWLKPYKTFDLENRMYSANENGTLTIPFDDFLL